MECHPYAFRATAVAPAATVHAPTLHRTSPVTCRRLAGCEISVRTQSSPTPRPTLHRQSPPTQVATSQRNPSVRAAAPQQNDHSACLGESNKQSSRPAPQLSPQAVARNRLARYVRESAVEKLNQQSALEHRPRPSPGRKKVQSPKRPWGSNHPRESPQKLWPAEEPQAAWPTEGSIGNRGYKLVAYLPRQEDGPWPPLAHPTASPGKVTIIAKTQQKPAKKGGKAARVKKKQTRGGVPGQ
eukprot:TRINITY_DN16051_c0_g1_i1.p1 TRINITY_DN16051_c0_g1~~TRINITY_DN16051_c0_g1_i1.p1  ORF type:complete len:241 (+),score=17.03 TRINITY_DN16051_c0_g1_i1:175-897(+)